jgi:hypothetical protein
MHHALSEFITERLTGLEFFLNHIGEHYKLHKASLTASFLSLSIDEFAAYKQNVSSGALSNDDEKSGASLECVCVCLVQFADCYIMYIHEYIRVCRAGWREHRRERGRRGSTPVQE